MADDPLGDRDPVPGYDRPLDDAEKQAVRERYEESRKRGPVAEILTRLVEVERRLDALEAKGLRT